MIHRIDAKAGEFWEWFRQITPGLAADPHDESIHQALTSQLAEFGVSGWEIGPGSGDGWRLAISPDGNRDLLSITRALVERAPAIPSWEFCPARPAREEWARLVLGEEGGRERTEVDASDWRYVLQQFGPEDFDIVIEQGGLAELDPDDRLIAALMVLDGLLGEEARLQVLGRVETVLALDGERGGRATALRYLPAHLRQVSG